MSEAVITETKPIRHPQVQNSSLLETPFKDVYTCSDMFFRSVSINGDKNCMGKRILLKIHTKEVVQEGKSKSWTIPEFGDTQWFTYKQVADTVVALGDGIMKFTGATGGDVIGIYDETKLEWMQGLLAATRHALVVATCYANLGLDALVHVINETSLTTLICHPQSIDTLDGLADQCPTLKYLLFVESQPSNNVKQSKKFKTMTYDECIKLGKENVISNPKGPSKDDICVLMYTSGSTGAPKGVMILHRNIVAAIAGCFAHFNFLPEDVYLGYLPLAHVLELVAEFAFLTAGGSIGYGSPRTLTDKGAIPCGDIRAIRPTHFAGVPRVYETIKKGALEKIHASGFLANHLFNSAYQAKVEKIYKGQDTPWWNWLVFAKFSEQLGGRIKAMLSGGAPLSKATHEFIRTCFGVPIVQGFGLTESCGSTCIQDLGLNSFVPLEVGRPLPCCELKLVSVPDMGYLATGKPPAGELLIRGGSVCAGYYKNEQKTKEDFDKDGWFHTGDIARLNESGTISIIDRKKNLIKLAHGEYVALENLESLYGGSPFVSPNGICLYGDSQENYIIAFVLPQKTYLQTWAQENGIPETQYEKLLQNKHVIQAVNQSFKDIAAKAKKKPFEVIGAFLLYDEEWTPENTMLTAAMKLKRENIYKKYRDNGDIKKMYDSLKSKE